jgi:hypothetical protein
MIKGFLAILIYIIFPIAILGYAIIFIIAFIVSKINKRSNK